MQSEQLRNTVRAVSDHHSDRSLSGTPFYKPTGRFFDAGIETDHVSHPSSAALHIGRLLLASYENEYIFIQTRPARSIWRSGNGITPETGCFAPINSGTPTRTRISAICRIR